MAHECAICYNDCGSSCKLTCGHAFCTGCIKTWYLKGTGTGCPMCRRPVYFRGFTKVQEQWDEESWDTRCTEAYGAAIDECLEEGLELAEAFGPKTARRILNITMEELRDIESTYNFMRSRDVSSEDIEYVLMETDESYSDRHMEKCEWIDEPQKAFATRYPVIARSGKGGKRARALADEWETLTFYIEV